MWLGHRYREQARTHWVFSRYKAHVSHKPCGSEPAREEAGPSNITAN